MVSTCNDFWRLKTLRGDNQNFNLVSIDLLKSNQNTHSFTHPQTSDRNPTLYWMQHFQMPKRSWRKRSMSVTDITGELPIYNPASTIGRRESQSWSTRSVVKYKRIHLIPLVVMLCFFILWCFSTSGISILSLYPFITLTSIVILNLGLFFFLLIIVVDVIYLSLCLCYISL